MQFINFADQDIAPINKELDYDIMEGTPKQKVWSQIGGAGGVSKPGMWDSTAGIFRVPMHDQIEFCHILEGEVRIEIGDGKSRTVKAGDAFVMTDGLQPIWHVETTVRKLCVIATA